MHLVSRNPFKALSIHVNHNECVFLRTSSSFRVSCYQIMLSAQDVFYKALPNLYPELSVLTLYPISVNAQIPRILSKSVY
jgi:hypothetical protein